MGWAGLISVALMGCGVAAGSGADASVQADASAETLCVDFCLRSIDACIAAEQVRQGIEPNFRGTCDAGR